MRAAISNKIYDSTFIGRRISLKRLLPTDVSIVLNCLHHSLEKEKIFMGGRCQIDFTKLMLYAQFTLNLYFGLLWIVMTCFFFLLLMEYAVMRDLQVR